MTTPDIPLDAWWGGRVRPQYIRIFSGDDRTLTFTIRDRQGAAVSITGTYSFKVAAGRRPSDSAEITKSGSVSTSSIAITLAATDTADLEGTFYYELQVTETSSSADSVVSYGRIEISEDM